MTFLKRFFLFGLVNIFMVVTISFIVRALGLDTTINAYGINYQSLAVMCLLWGMGGSFISLMISRWMAKRMMGVQVIDPQTAQGDSKNLLTRVYTMSRAADLTTMPEVGVYQSNDVNAFATGPSRNSALVAVSTGLLNRMNDKEVDGVLAHEVSHIANGDMVTMALIQGVINAFVMFLARIAAFFVSQLLRSNDDRDRGGSHWINWILIMVFEVVFSFAGMIVVSAFSRWREFRADKGSANIGGRDKMIAALQALQRIHAQPDADTPNAIKAFQINSGGQKSFMQWFATHPSLEDRIAALKQY